MTQEQLWAAARRILVLVNHLPLFTVAVLSLFFLPSLLSLLLNLKLLLSGPQHDCFTTTVMAIMATATKNTKCHCPRASAAWTAADISLQASCWLQTQLFKFLNHVLWSFLLILISSILPNHNDPRHLPPAATSSKQQHFLLAANWNWSVLVYY